MNCLVVALPSEARPLVDHFGLTGPESLGRFRLYRGADILLIVSGWGAQAAREAVSSLRRLKGVDESSTWLNVGIAGHRVWPVGTIALGSRVVDVAGGVGWDLEPPVEAFCRRSVVHSVRDVERDYPAEAMYEMEAAGFVAALPETAARYVLKIVSDNCEQPPEAVTARAIRKLVATALPVVETLLRRSD